MAGYSVTFYTFLQTNDLASVQFAFNTNYFHQCFTSSIYDNQWGINHTLFSFLGQNKIVHGQWGFIAEGLNFTLSLEKNTIFAFSSKKKIKSLKIPLLKPFVLKAILVKNPSPRVFVRMITFMNKIWVSKPFCRHKNNKPQQQTFKPAQNISEYFDQIFFLKQFFSGQANLSNNEKALWAFTYRRME